MKFGDISFFILHPIASCVVLYRRMRVDLEVDSPPYGTTFEEFGQLSLREAAKRIRLERDQIQDPGDIGPENWSPRDRVRLVNGQKPIGNHN